MNINDAISQLRDFNYSNHKAQHARFDSLIPYLKGTKWEVADENSVKASLTSLPKIFADELSVDNGAYDDNRGSMWIDGNCVYIYVNTHGREWLSLFRSRWGMRLYFDGKEIQ